MAIIIGVANTTLGTILEDLFNPVTFITLGLFTFIIDGFILWLVGKLIDGFHVKSFIWAIVGAIVLSLVNGFLGSIF